MKVNGTAYRSVWRATDKSSVEAIDQTCLPHEFRVVRLKSIEEVARAIQSMVVRGAPLIGATAAYGMALAMHADPSDTQLQQAHDVLLAARPTAVNLRWALDRMRALLAPLPHSARSDTAWFEAETICEEDIAINRAIGKHGSLLIRELWEKKSSTVNILTHCNAGWLATVDYGTALAPIYLAFDGGVPIHVWVDETRPRNQGAALTAWELGQHGVEHHVVVDSAGGHLMQRGLVDLVLVGTDRTTARGDVCNKVGTYLKALAANDNGIPFYVALPGPTLDAKSADGLRDIPIEIRDGGEVAKLRGRTDAGEIITVAVVPQTSPCFNPAFDVTPARLVTGFITERGICAAGVDGLRGLYPELWR
jgi:methylthioribose-1-phosphate isomerase